MARIRGIDCKETMDRGGHLLRGSWSGLIRVLTVSTLPFLSLPFPSFDREWFLLALEREFSGRGPLIHPELAS